MYGQEAHTASSKGKGGLSKSTALMKQMSGFGSENLCDTVADEDRTRDGNCSHTCKYCKRDFLSGRALGGHMRAHGALSFHSDAPAWNTNHHNTADRMHEKLEQLSSSGGHGDAQPSLEYDPDAESDHALSNSSYARLSCRIELDSRAGKPREFAEDFGHLARNSDDRDASGGKDGPGDEDEEEASIKASTNSVIYSNGDGADAHGDNAHDAEFDNAKWFSLHSKAHGGPLYTLRRNPKPSKRLVDQEYAAMKALQQASAPVAAASLKKSTSSNLFNDKVCACTECGKEFSSWKALFGHMRCHPEREWRGIQRPMAQDQEKPMDVFLPLTCKKKKPPSPCEEGDIESESDKVIKQSFTSDENSDAESIEAAYMNGGGKSSLQSWMTGKRSKRSRQVVRSLQVVTDNAPVNASSEIKEDTDMANCLVMLACASRSQKEPSQMKKMRRTASILSSDIDRRSHSGDIMHKNPSTISDQGHHWQHSKDPSSRAKPLKVNADDGSLSEGMNEETATDLHAGKAKFECGTCKRIFKSHQALGGHRASHKKVKGCFARTHANDGGDFPDSPEGDITDVDLPRYSDEERLPASASKHDHQIYGEDEKETTSYGNKLKPGINKRIKGHECSICHRVFSSGQALGGHKRCHWGGAGSETSNVPVSNSSQQQQAPAVSRGLFQRTGREELLDLNLPAPEEEYEDYYMDFRMSASALQRNQLTTKSISDENNIITVPKSPGELISSANDTQHKLTDSSNGRGEQFLYPGLKHVSAQETGSSKNYHIPAQETGLSRNDQIPAQESELEGSAEREILNNCRYMQCNICDKVFTSVEALGSHHKTHRSVMSSAAAPGLTPISA